MYLYICFFRIPPPPPIRFPLPGPSFEYLQIHFSLHPVLRSVFPLNPGRQPAFASVSRVVLNLALATGCRAITQFAFQFLRQQIVRQHVPRHLHHLILMPLGP